MKVNFRWDVYENVITPFGEKGFISMCGYNDSGKQYYVKTKDNENWYHEMQLKPAN